MSHQPARDGDQPHPAGTVAIRILTTLCYWAFAIVATVLAFVWFWPAGFVLAVVLAWLGLAPQLVNPLRGLPVPAAPEAPPSSGNAAFDAYRSQTLERLDIERKSFESFLGRLRAARDEQEFERFLTDRARAVAADPPNA